MALLICEMTFLGLCSLGSLGLASLASDLERGRKASKIVGLLVGDCVMAAVHVLVEEATAALAAAANTAC